MYPGSHAQNRPDKAAAINATTGEQLTCRELNDRSIQLARVWRDYGLQSGDHVALFYQLASHAGRSGLHHQ